jgi:hypothetical protein
MNGIFLVAFLPCGRASRAFNYRTVENTVIITFLIKIPGLSLGITSSRRRASLESDSIT